jgi:hypothetical protein
MSACFKSFKSLFITIIPNTKNQQESKSNIRGKKHEQNKNEQHHLGGADGHNANRDRNASICFAGQSANKHNKCK